MSSRHWPALPYHVGGPVWDERQFAGRKMLLSGLTELANNVDKEGFILSGPRRIGKTSVLERLKRSLGSNAKVVKLDLLTVLLDKEEWEPRTVTPTILSSVLSLLEGEVEEIPPNWRQILSQPFNATAFRSQVLPDLLSAVAPQRLVIFLDEMEVAYARDPNAPSDIANALLPLPGFRGRKPFVGIVWGRPFGRGQRSSREIPSRLKDFVPEELGRFSLIETQQAIQQPVLDIYIWTNDAIERVHQLTSGHPLFTASIGAAVHARRDVDDASPVSVEEVNNSVDEALRHADGWQDAWGQLHQLQKILLRALASSPGSDLDEVVSISRKWGSPYRRAEFERLLAPLDGDGLITPTESGLHFQVDMVARWISRKKTGEILGAPEDPQVGVSRDADENEQDGLRLYDEGQLDQAAVHFSAALKQDPARWRAAVWLARILVQRDKSEAAADILRVAAPTAEVRHVRAQVLAECLKRALDTHEDAAKWVTELRTIDPHHEEAPEAAELIAVIEVDEWWRTLEKVTGPESIEATDRHILGVGSHCVNAGLKRVRIEVEAAMEGARSIEEVRTLIWYVLPYLLRESEPIALLESGDSRPPSSDYLANWNRCYSTAVSAVVSLGFVNARRGFREIPPTSILRLLECRSAATSLGAPLRALVLSIATAEHLTELIATDPPTARGVVALLEQTDRAEAIQRIGQAFGDSALAASSASSGQASQVAMALRALPALGLALVRLLHGFEAYISESHFDDLIAASGFLVDRLEADAALASGVVDTETLGEWQTLLAAIHSNGLTDAEKLQARLQSLVEPSGLPTEETRGPIRRRIDKEIVQEILGGTYRVKRQVRYPIHGVPTGYVLAWSVENRAERKLLARAYRVDGGEPKVQAFLAYLWENERRLLSTLGTRWEGRALPRLYISRYEPEIGVLVLVTDFVGPKTLRQLLSSGEIANLRRISRKALWAHLQSLIEALAALHRAGYLHRAVRPENILVDPDVRSNRGHRWLRLSNFEWSVYLFGIASSPAADARQNDRYSSPEALAVHRGASDPTSFVGEGTTSDAFALGLVLFECLVEPLNREELSPLPVSYGIPEHLSWVNQLFERIDKALDRNELWTGEVELLKGLLRADPRRRTADLDSLMDKVSRLAQQDTLEQADDQYSPLHLVTTLQIGTKESIARFIQEELSTEVPTDINDVTSLAKWIEEELKNAVIRPNRRSGAPILLEGRSLNFTVHPFKIHGKEQPHIGWLKVANDHDGPAGTALGKLFHGVKVHNYRRDMKLAPLLLAPNGWDNWFSAVERMHEGLTVNERAFVDRIRWTIELERRSWERHVLSYERVEYSPGKRPGEVDIVVIRKREDPRDLRTYSLVDLMAQSVDRENVWFELGKSADPTSAFHQDRRWIQVKSDGDTDKERGLIRLTRNRREGAEEPPSKGWIRPYSLAGHRTLYERRKEVLADVEHDPFLVRSILTPNETFDDLNLKPTRVFDARLDADKEALAIAIRNRLPLFVVQGPPGTGKTTLATEVILRTLHEQPSSRILVVAQAHDPLNHLLERVEKELDGWKKSSGAYRRPTSVRLTSEERLDERRYGQEGTKVPRKYHPSRVAADIMATASAWRPGPDDVGLKAVEAWRRVCATHALHGLSRSLERRLVASANVVYATTNDRRLAAIRPGSFDLVIYEEAAKALPIEVLGPLRLARRWLLIGDQAQLPPFGLDDIDEVLKRDISNLRTDYRHRGRVGADSAGVDPFNILGEVPPDQQSSSHIAKEMTRLLRFFSYVFQRASNVPVGHSQSAPDEAGAIKGLTGMLTTQWRMHPVIGDFVSKCFYEGRVRNGAPELLAGWRRHGLVAPPEVRERSIIWLDTPWIGDEPLATERSGFGGGAENGFEARVVMGFLRDLLKDNRLPLSLAIMSPYRAQVSALSKLIKEYHFTATGDLQNSLHTADSFQGKQADVVVVSLVRNNQPKGPKSLHLRTGIGFLYSPERSTVIFSRAEKLLVIVGCMKHFKQFPDTPLFEVVREIESLARQNEGVVILPGQSFIEQRYWEDLRKYHDLYEKRVLDRRESEDRRLKKEFLHE